VGRKNNLWATVSRPCRQQVGARSFDRHLANINPRRRSSSQRNPATAASFGVIDSISISPRVRANKSMHEKSTRLTLPNILWRLSRWLEGGLKEMRWAIEDWVSRELVARQA